MSGSLIAACLWAIAATITALLPMKRQFPPGITLLVLAPFLLIWLGIQHNPWIVGICTLGFLSMFRNPLIYFGKRALGLPVNLPPELRDRPDTGEHAP
jgi:hypothetical protein